MASCETREQRQDAIRQAMIEADLYRRWHDDHAAELLDALREVLGWAGWQVREVNVDALCVRLRARGREDRIAPGCCVTRHGVEVRTIHIDGGELRMSRAVRSYQARMTWRWL